MKGIRSLVVALTAATTTLILQQETALGKAAKDLDFNARIVGGTEVEPDSSEYNWVVSLQDRKKHYCGGSLISPTFVLTAAHCLHGFDPPTNVVMGAVHLREASESRIKAKVKKIYEHNKYNENKLTNDIALIELTEPVTTIDPIMLINHKESEAPGQMLQTVGWGATREGGKGSKTLMKVSVPAVSNQDCIKSYSKGEIFNTMICAGYKEGGKDSCSGDSGSSLFHDDGEKKTLVGITSFGNGCALPEMYGVYTRVSSFEKWIKGIVKDLPSLSGIQATPKPTKPTKAPTSTLFAETNYCQKQKSSKKCGKAKPKGRCSWNIETGGCESSLIAQGVTFAPSAAPSMEPTTSPSKAPTTRSPTLAPTIEFCGLECYDLSREGCPKMDGCVWERTKCINAGGDSYSSDYSSYDYDYSSYDYSYSYDYSSSDYGYSSYEESFCYSLNQKECGREDECFWDKDGRFCYPNFDGYSSYDYSSSDDQVECEDLNSKECGREDACIWDDRERECVHEDDHEVECEDLNSKECGKQDECIWDDRERECVHEDDHNQVECEDLNSKECGREDECVWDNKEKECISQDAYSSYSYDYSYYYEGGHCWDLNKSKCDKEKECGWDRDFDECVPKGWLRNGRPAAGKGKGRGRGKGKGKGKHGRVNNNRTLASLDSHVDDNEKQIRAARASALNHRRIAKARAEKLGIPVKDVLEQMSKKLKDRKLKNRQLRQAKKEKRRLKRQERRLKKQLELEQEQQSSKTQD